MSTKSNVVTALLALTTGAVLGLLFAPASGKETRNNIARKASKIGDTLSEKMEEGSELLDKLKGATNDLANKGKDAANSAKSGVKEMAHETAGAARSASNSGYKG